MRKAKLNQLEMLVAVAERGSFGGAAAELDCTQSRISHGITELEAALGARLLTRARTGCTPTEAGLRVLATARQMLHLAQALPADAAGSACLAGHVRIACFRSIGTHLLPLALEALASVQPGIRVDVDDAYDEREDVVRAVRSGHADIGIAQLPVGNDLLVQPFVADDYVLVLPAARPVHQPLGWDQLAGIPYLQLNCSGALAIAAQLRQAGLDARPARLLATDSSIVAMVRQGLGFALLPRLSVYPEPDGVRVLPLPPLPFSARRAFALVALPATARLAAVKALMAHIRNRKLIAASEAFKAGLVRW